MTAIVTLFIVAIASRSVLAIRAGHFFPSAAVVEHALIEMAGADGVH
jgi:hypothetical protein